MTFHRRSARRLLTAAVLGLGLALSAPAAVLADPAQIGDTPADFARPVAAQPKAGDTPADFQRIRSLEAGPIEVVQPERTIVRDVDQTLPIALAGLAMLIALGGAGYAVLGTRALRRSAAGH